MLEKVIPILYSKTNKIEPTLESKWHKISKLTCRKYYKQSMALKKCFWEELDVLVCKSFPPLDQSEGKGKLKLAVTSWNPISLKRSSPRLGAGDQKSMPKHVAKKSMGITNCLLSDVWKMQINCKCHCFWMLCMLRARTNKIWQIDAESMLEKVMPKCWNKSPKGNPKGSQYLSKSFVNKCRK